MPVRNKLTLTSSSVPDVRIPSIISETCGVNVDCIVLLGNLRGDRGFVYRVDGVYSGSTDLFERLTVALSHIGDIECHYDGCLNVYVYPVRSTCTPYVLLVLLLIFVGYLTIPDVHKEYFKRIASVWIGSMP